MSTTNAKPKNSNIHARVDSRIRNDAENILNSMGITISQFINMALYQVHIKRKIPFELESAYQFPQSLYDELDEADENRATTKYVPATESYSNMKARLKGKYDV